MYRWIAILLLVATGAVGQTKDCTNGCTLVTDQFPSGLLQPDSCRLYNNGVAVLTSPVVASGAGVACLFTPTFAQGASVSAFATALAGGVESGPSNVLAFISSRGPPAPTNTIVAQDIGGPPPMSITFDNKGLLTGTTGTVAGIYVVGAGSNSALVVVVTHDNTTTITSATYNGVSLGTALWDLALGAVGGQNTAFLLKSPAAGSNTLSITFSGTNPSNGAEVMISSWFGVDQTTPNRTPVTAIEGGGNTTESLSVSNAVAGDVVIDGLASYTVPTPDVAQTVLWNVFASGSIRSGNSWVLATGPTTMSWTITAVGLWAVGGVALVPAAAPSAFFGRPYYDMIGAAH